MENIQEKFKARNQAHHQLSLVSSLKMAAGGGTFQPQQPGEPIPHRESFSVSLFTAHGLSLWRSLTRKQGDSVRPTILLPTVPEFPVLSISGKTAEKCKLPSPEVSGVVPHLSGP